MSPTVDELRVKKIILVDKNDEQRAVLGVTPSGSGGLMLNDPAGNLRGVFAVLADGSAQLALFDEHRKANLTATVAAKGNVQVHLADPNRKGGITVGLDTDSGALFGFGGEGGEPRVILHSLPGDGSGLTVFDRERRPRLILSADDAGVPSLQFLDENGRVRSLVAMTADGRTGVYFFDDAGKEIAKLPRGSGLPSLKEIDLPGLIRLATELAKIAREWM